MLKSACNNHSCGKVTMLPNCIDNCGWFWFISCPLNVVLSHCFISVMLYCGVQVMPLPSLMSRCVPKVIMSQLTWL